MKTRFSVGTEWKYDILFEDNQHNNTINLAGIMKKIFTSERFFFPVWIWLLVLAESLCWAIFFGLLVWMFTK